VRRLAGTLTLLAALAAAPTAHAQAARPAVGGGSFNDAPLLAPGSYRDTIRAGERLYYAFSVQPGQRLHVTAVAPGDGEHVPEGPFTVGIATPLRDPNPEPFDQDIAGNGNSVFYTNRRMELVTPAVPTFAAADREPPDTGYDGPGTWFVTLRLASTDTVPRPIEVPVELSVAVEGQPQAEPRPTRTPAPTATAAPEKSQTSGGTGVAALLAALVGLLAGLAVAAITVRRRARPGTRPTT
jgi:Ca-activated chloride channel family protein